jgi:hypothetical protein
MIRSVSGLPERPKGSVRPLAKVEQPAGDVQPLESGGPDGLEAIEERGFLRVTARLRPRASWTVVLSRRSPTRTLSKKHVHTVPFEQREAVPTPRAGQGSKP